MPIVIDSIFDPTLVVANQTSYIKFKATGVDYVPGSFDNSAKVNVEAQDSGTVVEQFLPTGGGKHLESVSGEADTYIARVLHDPSTYAKETGGKDSDPSVSITEVLVTVTNVDTSDHTSAQPKAYLMVYPDG